jgi:hypothetical protein
VPFLGPVFQSIFPLFLDFARSVSCLFYCTFRPSGWICGPFLDLFWTVLFIMRRFLSLRYSSSKEWPGLSCLVCLSGVEHTSIRRGTYLHQAWNIPPSGVEHTSNGRSQTHSGPTSFFRAGFNHGSHPHLAGRLPSSERSSVDFRRIDRRHIQ